MHPLVDLGLKSSGAEFSTDAVLRHLLSQRRNSQMSVPFALSAAGWNVCGVPARGVGNRYAAEEVRKGRSLLPC